MEFISHNPRRLYCSERCRRDQQNELRRDRRAEEREAREASHWDYDPWERDDLGDEVLTNALLDAAPILSDNPWGGVQIDIPKKTWLWLPGLGVPQ
jgi:hypothetical protein